MQEVITQFQVRKRERHAAIIADYKAMMAEGHQPGAIYRTLAAKYGYTRHHVWKIIKDNEL